LRIINNIDIETVRNRRIKNAKILYDGIKGFDFISPLIPKPDFNNNCPLFVPLVVNLGKRDELRQYLIENNVYCPVHWPENTGSRLGICKSELSLICDQRYNEKDMEYILFLIETWCKNSKKEK